MSKPTTSTSTISGKPTPTWQPGAWTPQRCTVWNLRGGADRDEFSAWVSAEAKANEGGCYSHQIRPQDQTLLDAQESAKAA